MADTKITALTALTAADPANDVIPIVDVSDTSMAASGTTKKISVNNILGASGTATLASATITGAATVGTTLGVTGDLTVDTNVLKVDTTNDRVGIGTATPTQALHVIGNILTVSAVGTDSYVNVATAGVQNSFFGFNNSGSTNASGASNNHQYISNGNGYPIQIATNGVSIATFSTAAVTFTAQNLVMATSGKGIDFSATASGSGTMTSELLNDYEEGTWTPVVADAGTGGNVGTCSINGATYTKIGRQVSVQTYISAINTTGMTGTEAFRIRGFPFAAVRGGNGNFYSYRVGRNASTVSSSVSISDGNSNVYFPLYTTNSATTDLFITVADIVSGTSEITLSVTYFV